MRFQSHLHLTMTPNILRFLLNPFLLSNFNWVSVERFSFVRYFQFHFLNWNPFFIGFRQYLKFGSLGWLNCTMGSSTCVGRSFWCHRQVKMRLKSQDLTASSELPTKHKLRSSNRPKFNTESNNSYLRNTITYSLKK